MGHSIFDWDEEGEKNEAARPAQSHLVEEPIFERPEEPPPWNDPWQQPANEDSWEKPQNERQSQRDDQWHEPVSSWSEQKPVDQEPIEYVPYQPESVDETIRRGGLAWSAGIVFFSSIVFMLFIGWVVDWLFQSSPWGIVGGIVVGSILGFVQFFRISSQIFDSKKSEAAIRPLMPRDDDDQYH